MTASHWVPELPPGRMVSLPGRGRLLVRDLAGPPGAPVLMLLHGWTATSSLNWFAAFDALTAHYRVIAFDHRGHGDGLRTRRPFRLADCADDAVAVADALGVEKFVPVGYSMGGPIALLTQRRHAERVEGLVLCATAMTFGATRLARLQLAAFFPAAVAARLLPGHVARSAYLRVVRQRCGPAPQPWVLGQIAAGHPRAVVEAGAALGTFDARGWIRQVDLPTSMVVIDGDTIVPTRDQDALAAALPDATVVRIEGGHDVCLRHPARFCEALLTACSEVTAGRPESVAN